MGYGFDYAFALRLDALQSIDGLTNGWMALKAFVSRHCEARSAEAIQRFAWMRVAQACSAKSRQDCAGAPRNERE